jgi:hypothetical protein
MLGPRTAALLLALATAGCGSSPAPPEELAGLWSPGDASCEAGVGVRFTSEAIEAVYDRDTQVLFNEPRYEVVHHGDDFKVRIAYQLPRIAGGARTVGAHGVIVLERAGEGVAPVSHTLVDPFTGAARTRVANDPASALLTLKPCAIGHPWRAGLRGR